MAKDSLVKASTPEPFSRSKTSNWVARGGGLPDYIQHIAHDLVEKRGKSESQAIQMAIGIVKRWARGGGNVDANTRAAAAKAVAEWEALKAKNSAKKITETPFEDRPAEDRAIAEAVTPPRFLFAELDPQDVGDLALLGAASAAPIQQQAIGSLTAMGFSASDAKGLVEAASPTPMSSTPRRPGESLTSWGERLQAGDKALAAKQAKKTKTRSGASGSFNAKHPRGRGGKWTFKQSASGAEVRGIQRRVGAKVDGAFGTKTKAAIERFQRAHGLQVDGVVGRQTVAALRGRKGKVTPGWMGPKDKAWLAGHAANRGH